MLICKGVKRRRRGLPPTDCLCYILSRPPHFQTRPPRTYAPRHTPPRINSALPRPPTRSTRSSTSDPRLHKSPRRQRGQYLRLPHHRPPCRSRMLGSKRARASIRPLSRHTILSSPDSHDPRLMYPFQILPNAPLYHGTTVRNVTGRLPRPSQKSRHQVLTIAVLPSPFDRLRIVSPLTFLLPTSGLS